MRLLVIVLSVLLLLSVFGFVVTNLDATVSVTLWNTHYPSVPLHLVILSSLVAGIVYIGIIAVAEGVNTRLANRRLTREVQRLEGELNYLRTEPTRSSSEPAAETAEEPIEEERVAYELDEDRTELPSAPVYGSDDEDPESDDDIYSGGRAV